MGYTQKLSISKKQNIRLTKKNVLGVFYGKNTLKNLYNFYSKYNYKYINDIYKFNKIDSLFVDNNIVHKLHEIIIQGDSNIPKISDTYELYHLTNNNYLSPFVVKIIDILNRYFKHLSTEYDIINFAFYITDDTNKHTIQKEINNAVNTIDQYREDKISNHFEIKYQNQDIKNDSQLNKLNFIITYGDSLSYNNKKLLNYIDTKLIEGGNFILVANMNIPIKSLLVEELFARFKKPIITNATLDTPFEWIFIGKGYTPQHKGPNDTLINNAFIKKCKEFDNFLKQININTLPLVNQINAKYIKIYRWCLDNNIEAINIFSDTDKEPQLVDSNKVVDIFFPDQKGVDKHLLKMLDISMYSVTLPKEANIISMTIKKLLGIIDKSYLHHRDISITDWTANVGGNTLSFSSHFAKVNSIEYNKKTYDGLVHNCEKVYGRSNITFYHGDCTRIVPGLKQDVIFIDPPWNGLFYKAYDKLHLKLGNRDCFDIILDWFNNKKAKLYCMKVPSNFDFEQFINTYSNIYIQKLKNWNVIYTF